jgi:hypothetical protein
MERGDSVIVVDNFFTGRKENVMRHLSNPQFELIRHDVVEPLMLEVDQIYHLACPASPVHYKYNPVKTIISSPIRFDPGSCARMLVCVARMVMRGVDWMMEALMGLEKKCSFCPHGVCAKGIHTV